MSADRRRPDREAGVVGIGRQPHFAGPLRGDIHIAELHDRGGSAIRGPHPVVVVQTDRLQRSSTVVVVPLTSAARAAEFEPPFLVQVLARASGLPRDGWAKCDQPLTIPIDLLGGRLGRLDPETIDRMDDALRFVLGL
jgi:mRNA-degrading endonuclease toxin of MazEF toxin-antitoxin module